MNTSRTARVGGMTAVVAVVVSFATIAAAAGFGPWGAPANAESPAGTSSELNTSYTDGCPIQSPDGLSLYMASNRVPGGLGGLDIWVAHRASKDAPYGAPVNLGAPINSSSDDFCPTPVRGKRLFFVSARDGGCGGPDIYLTRDHPKGGWEEPRNLGCQVNSGAGEAGPSFFEAGGEAVLYFSSTRPGGFDSDPEPSGDSDIYASVVHPDGSFGTADQVPVLNTSGEDARPNVRKDGAELVFDSNREGTLGGPDIYTATRHSATDDWSTPLNLGPTVNTPSNESRASLSWDGLTLYFGSNRPGSEPDPVTGAPSNDVYFTTRGK